MQADSPTLNCRRVTLRSGQIRVRQTALNAAVLLKSIRLGRVLFDDPSTGTGPKFGSGRRIDIRARHRASGGVLERLFILAGQIDRGDAVTAVNGSLLLAI